MASTNFEDLILRDITANRPAAGVPGRLFFDTTLSKMQRDNGSSWDDVESTATGSVSGPGSSTSGHVATWNGTGGNVLADGGKAQPTGAFVGTSDSQTLASKTLDNTNTITVKDTLLTIQDDGDATKQAKFQASGITAGQTRVMTIPDADATLVGVALTQTLTNKTLTAPTIADFTNAAHDHGDADDGGTLVAAALPVMTGDSGAGGVKGAVPAPAAGDAAASKFLKADATWAVPAGGGGGSLTQAYAGYNTIGGSTETPGVNSKVYAKKITLANDCLLTSIGAYILQGGGNAYGPAVAVYTDSSGPDMIVACNNGDAPLLYMTSGARWVDIPVGVWLTAGDYWIVVRIADVGAAALCQIKYDGSGSDRTATGVVGWYDWSNYGSPTTSSNKYSIRANTIR